MLAIPSDYRSSWNVHVRSYASLNLQELCQQTASMSDFESLASPAELLELLLALPTTGLHCL